MGKPKYVQLRLTPAEHEELAKVADAAGRTVPAEIMHRVGLLEGDDEEPGDDARALGDLVALLARRANQALSTLYGEPWEVAKDEAALGDVIKARRAQVATNTHYALGLVLHELGAMTAKADSKVTDFMTWDIAAKVKKPSKKDDTAEGQTLARIGKVLEFKTGE